MGLEMIVGAILTQNTAWSNVEKAIVNLRKAGLLSVKKLREVRTPRLASLIRSSGYFNQKAIKLKAFLSFLDSEYGGSLGRMGRETTRTLREKLLSVHGIGPETADSILLYAFEKRLFVVDAYTLRIFARHGLLHARASYDESQRFFMERLPARARLYNEYHALIVRAGKEYCRKAPRCGGCPLNRFLRGEVKDVNH